MEKSVAAAVSSTVCPTGTTSTSRHMAPRADDHSSLAVRALWAGWLDDKPPAVHYLEVDSRVWLPADQLQNLPVAELTRPSGKSN